MLAHFVTLPWTSLDLDEENSPSVLPAGHTLWWPEIVLLSPAIVFLVLCKAIFAARLYLKYFNVLFFHSRLPIFFNTSQTHIKQVYKLHLGTGLKNDSKFIYK